MADRPDKVAERSITRTAAVCEHQEEIRAELHAGAQGDAEPLERVLAAVLRGGDLDAPLNDLHAALQAGGDAHGLDGYGNGAHRPVRGPRPVGITSTGPGETVYLCPQARCARNWVPQGSQAVPTCTISGVGLRRTRL